MNVITQFPRGDCCFGEGISYFIRQDRWGIMLSLVYDWTTGSF